MNKFHVTLFVLLSLAPLLLAGTSSEDGYLQRGSGFLLANKYEQSVREFRQATRINPSRAEAWMGLGTGLLRVGNTQGITNVEVLEQAVEAFTTALKLNPDLAMAHRYLGEAYLFLHDRKKAVQEQLALRNIDPRLAEDLATAVTAYREPSAYREITSPNEAGDSITTVNIKHNLVLVPVTLYYGQQTAEVLLALDTGASITVINSSVASRLGIRLTGEPSGKVQVVGGGLIKASAARLDRLSVGPHSRKGMIVAVINQQGPAMPFDGLLGMDFLKDLKYHVDFKNKQILWGK